MKGVLMKDKKFSGRSVPKKASIRSNYRTDSNRNQEKFNKSKLSSPITVLKILGISPGRVNSKDYWSIKCPFHNNGQEKHPSLNLHQGTGHFKCHACGEKGGDILDFYMKFTGKGFVESAKILGAWG
jgi:hypothetical protein